MEQLQGKIIKGIGGFYYVYVEARGVYECKAKGIFRKDGIKPLVGDVVRISVISEEDMEGNIDEICARHNTLIRPAVANVDQAMVVFAAAEPEPNFNLLDRFLISMKMQDVPTIICFNKVDIVEDSDIVKLANIYEKSGSKVCFISVQEDDGVDEVRELLKGKTTVLAGPSGVGKSSLLNKLKPEANMQTGEISKKLKRGKHTTRHSEVFYIEHETYVMDTPGFSSLDVRTIEKEDVKEFFPEFYEYEDGCKFLGCLHYKEPQCGVKDAVRSGDISRIRYKNYMQLLEEIDSKKKY